MLPKTTLLCSQVVQQEFEALFPGEVEHVRLVKDTTTLDSLVGEYTKVKRQLEDLVDEYQGRRKRLLKVKRRTVRVLAFQFTICSWLVYMYRGRHGMMGRPPCAL